MASTPSNVKLGVCRLYYDGFDLGYTKGGVEVEVSTETKKVMVDQFGNTEINEYIIGRTIQVRVPLAETTLELLARIMPGATLISDGTKATGAIEFTGNAENSDSITINGVQFTFKTTASDPNDIEIGATTDETIQNAVTVLQASTNPNVAKATYAADTENDEIVITYSEIGTVGNAFTLAVSGVNMTVSGANLANGTDATASKVEVTNAINTSLFDIAKELTLHPIQKADHDRSEDFVVPIAATAGALTFAYKLDEERVFNCTFVGYPDPDTRVLFIYGDKTATAS